jgi:predicted O-methyltransferase YrrM
MAFKSQLRSDAVARYVNVDMLRETALQKRLRDETAKLPNGGMQISPDQGAFLAMLVKLMTVKRALEIGAFTGYSGLAIASALPQDGKLTCLDVSDEYTQVARRYWAEAGVADKIDLRIAPALQTLAKLITEGDKFDLVFIDADKDNYPTYYEQSLKLLRPNGLILLDNKLDGRSEDPSQFDPVTGPRHGLNMQLRNDDRVEVMAAMIGGGLVMARKK